MAGLVKPKRQKKQITKGTIKVWLWRSSQFWTHQSLLTEPIRAHHTADSTAVNKAFAFAVAMVKGRTHTIDKQREGMGRGQLACDVWRAMSVLGGGKGINERRVRGLWSLWKPGRLRQEVWTIGWIRSQPGKLRETLPQNGLGCGTLVYSLSSNPHTSEQEREGWS